MLGGSVIGIKCCRRKDATSEYQGRGKEATNEDQGRRKDATDEDQAREKVTSDISDEVFNQMRRLTCEQLKQQCRIRGLKVGGLKDELIKRLLAESATAEKPTRAQLETIAKLEIRLGTPAHPDNFMSKQSASKRIESLQQLLKPNEALANSL